MSGKRLSTIGPSERDSVAPGSVLPALRTVEEAGVFLGLSKSSVRRLTRQGLLASVKPFGVGEIRFRVEDLQAFVDGLQPANQSGGKPTR